MKGLSTSLSRYRKFDKADARSMTLQNLAHALSRLSSKTGIARFEGVAIRLAHSRSAPGPQLALNLRPLSAQYRRSTDGSPHPRSGRWGNGRARLT